MSIRVIHQGVQSVSNVFNRIPPSPSPLQTPPTSSQKTTKTEINQTVPLLIPVWWQMWSVNIWKPKSIPRKKTNSSIVLINRIHHLYGGKLWPQLYEHTSTHEWILSSRKRKNFFIDTDTRTTTTIDSYSERLFEYPTNTLLVQFCSVNIMLVLQQLPPQNAKKKRPS